MALETETALLYPTDEATTFDAVKSLCTDMKIGAVVLQKALDTATVEEIIRSDSQSTARDDLTSIAYFQSSTQESLLDDERRI